MVIIDYRSFELKSAFTVSTNNDATVDVEMVVSLEYLENFQRTLQTPLINFRSNLILTWSTNYVIWEAGRPTAFTIAYTKLYIPVATLSSQDNSKLLEQLKSEFKRTVNWNKYQ